MAGSLNRTKLPSVPLRVCVEGGWLQGYSKSDVGTAVPVGGWVGIGLYVMACDERGRQCCKKMRQLDVMGK